MVRKDSVGWKRFTSRARQVNVKNRLVSERRSFPKAVFEVPVAPADINKLKLVRTSQKGATGKATFFGKVDFKVGGNPTDNLLVISYVNDNGSWAYDGSEFVNLIALPDVRKKLLAGDLGYVASKDFEAAGKAPAIPSEVGPAQIIAKVYAFCPGREVKVLVNGISSHRFQNSKAAEVIIGGAKIGSNEIQLATKVLEGAKGTEAITVRVYLMSRVPGSKPVKAFEYQVNEGGQVKAVGTSNFSVDQAMARKLNG